MKWNKLNFSFWRSSINKPTHSFQLALPNGRADECWLLKSNAPQRNSPAIQNQNNFDLLNLLLFHWLPSPNQLFHFSFHQSTINPILQLLKKWNWWKLIWLKEKESWLALTVLRRNETARFSSLIHSFGGPSPSTNQINSIFPLGREDWNWFWFCWLGGPAVSIAIPFIIPFKNSKFFHSMNMQQLYWRQITVIILF